MRARDDDEVDDGDDKSSGGFVGRGTAEFIDHIRPRGKPRLAPTPNLRGTFLLLRHKFKPHSKAHTI